MSNMFTRQATAEEVLPQLLTTLPDYIERLAALAKRCTDDLDSIEPIAPGMPDEPGAPAAPKPIAKPLEQPVKNTSSDSLPQHEVGSKKMAMQPRSNIARFSRLTGPEIYYDGESQKLWHDTWMALNQHRGQLRKEMMAVKRKRIMMPAAGFGYDSDDDLSPDDDEDEENESEEQKAKRKEEEKKKKEAEMKKAEEDKKKGEVLEYIDGRLDKASRAAENSAFIWLKGDGQAGHAVWINQRLEEALVKIREVVVVNEDEGFEEEEEEVVVAPSYTRKAGIPDNFGEDIEVDLEVDDAEDSESELKHKIPMNRKRIPPAGAVVAPDPTMRPVPRLS